MNKIESHSHSFLTYYQFLKEENEKYNLTAITSFEEVYEKHFKDSLMVCNVIPMEDIKTICDVGSGAGFPGIPLKIVFPHLSLTIIEPTQKRCQFLKKLIEKLELKDVTIINDRAENQNNLREHFDLVCARAVASLPILLELCIPLVKKDKYFIAMKGSNYQEEIHQASHACKVLDCVLEMVQTYELSQGFGTHSLLRYKKNKITKSSYPRHYATIKKKPL